MLMLRSKLFRQCLEQTNTDSWTRYQLADAAPEDWEAAEKQVKAGKNTSVAVKGKNSESKKRKPGEAVAEAYQEVDRVREKKKHKKVVFRLDADLGQIVWESKQHKISAWPFLLILGYSLMFVVSSY